MFQRSQHGATISPLLGDTYIPTNIDIEPPILDNPRRVVFVEHRHVCCIGVLLISL